MFSWCQTKKPVNDAHHEKKEGIVIVVLTNNVCIAFLQYQSIIVMLTGSFFSIIFHLGVEDKDDSSGMHLVGFYTRNSLQWVISVFMQSSYHKAQIRPRTPSPPALGKNLVHVAGACILSFLASRALLITLGHKNSIFEIPQISFCQIRKINKHYN